MPGAAEPAGTTPTPVGGDIIHLDGRRQARGDRDEAKGPTVEIHGDPTENPEILLAVRAQGLYLDRDRTLADPSTAEAYDIAISVFALIVNGAQARGGLSDADHDLLQRMLATARRVPGMLSPE